MLRRSAPERDALGSIPLQGDFEMWDFIEAIAEMIACAFSCVVFGGGLGMLVVWLVFL